MFPAPQSYLEKLVCPECGTTFDPDTLNTFCTPCSSPVEAKYNMSEVQKGLNQEEINNHPNSIWKWAELLPVRSLKHRITLGEGNTPLLRSTRLAEHLQVNNLFIKDEAVNPTGTFKARGLLMAVARGMELGVRNFVIPTAGNAGGALAAYAARAKCEAHIFMPEDAPRVNKEEVISMGMDLHLVRGSITDAARAAREMSSARNWFDVSTFKEPYRLEGKKTMGLELAQQLHWTMPDVIIYPTGGGTGLVGMWKAFSELEELGWINAKRPRMVSVQASGCAPIVKTFHAGEDRTGKWENAQTIASGLRVPVVFADRMILRILHESKGTAVDVSDQDILIAQKDMAQLDGIFAAPEGAATLAAFKKLLEQGWILPDEKVVLFNTGSGLKYI